MLFKYNEVEILNPELSRKAIAEAFRELNLYLENIETNINTKLMADVRDFGAKADGDGAKTDNTQAFIDALAKEAAVYVPPGIFGLDGGFALDGDKSLHMTSGTTLQRFGGGSTEPMIHMYGNKNVLDPNGATIRQNLYSHIDGIIRIGPAAGEVEGGITDVACRGNQISSHFKLLGAWSVTGQDKSVGLYGESIRRKNFTVTNPTYGTHIESGEIYNCDVNAYFSTDFNRSRINLELYQFGTAAIILGACIRNKFDIFIETAQAITPEVWRQAVHLGTQNYLGMESGTTGYSITAAWKNKLDIDGELVSSGTSKCRLLNWNEPDTSSAEGRNTLDIIGQFGGGIGEDGTTDITGVGSNHINSSDTLVDHVRPQRFHDFHIRRLDDESGHIFRKDSWGILVDRETGIAEGGTENIIEIDDIGTTRAGFSIHLWINAQSTTNNVVTAGEVHYDFELESTPAYNIVKSLDTIHSFGGSNPAVIVSAAAVAGTVANTMKVTITLTGGNPTGTNTFICAWKAEYLSTKLTGTNFDPDADITLEP